MVGRCERNSPGLGWPRALASKHEERLSVFPATRRKPTEARQRDGLVDVWHRAPASRALRRCGHKFPGAGQWLLFRVPRAPDALRSLVSLARSSSGGDPAHLTATASPSLHGGGKMVGIAMDFFSGAPGDRLKFTSTCMVAVVRCGSAATPGSAPRPPAELPRPKKKLLRTSPAPRLSSQGMIASMFVPDTNVALGIMGIVAGWMPALPSARAAKRVALRWKNDAPSHARSSDLEHGAAEPVPHRDADQVRPLGVSTRHCCRQPLPASARPSAPLAPCPRSTDDILSRFLPLRPLRTAHGHKNAFPAPRLSVVLDCIKLGVVARPKVSESSCKICASRGLLSPPLPTVPGNSCPPCPVLARRPGCPSFCGLHRGSAFWCWWRCASWPSSSSGRTLPTP